MKFYCRMPYQVDANHASVTGRHSVLSSSWTENLAYYYGNIWGEPSTYEATLLQIPRWSGFTCQSWDRTTEQSQWELRPTEKIYIERRAKNRDFNRKTKIQKQKLDDIIKDLAFSTRPADQLAKAARRAYRRLESLKQEREDYAANYEMRTGNRRW